MQAVILAGGFGTRLQPVISNVPKPMAPINGTPFLAMLIRHLKTQGITRVVLATHYMHLTIENFFNTNFEGMPITYAVEKEPLFAGGAIVNAIHTANLTQPFLVINGDTFIDVNYKTLYNHHITNNAQITMVLRHLEDATDKGVVETTGNRITKFGAKGAAGQPGLINAGVWVMNPEVLTAYPQGQAFSFEKDFLEANVPHNIQPHAFPVGSYFLDFGTPETYARAQTELPAILA